jgi:hypothetical protein
MLWIVTIGAFLLVLIYFLSQKREADESWKRYREKLEGPPPERRERTIDPNFVFDEPDKDQPDN